jgi:hypothetical protein
MYDGEKGIPIAAVRNEQRSERKSSLNYDPSLSNESLITAHECCLDIGIIIRRIEGYR